MGKPLPRDLLVVGSAFLTYLVLLGLGEDPSRQPTFSRFQLPTAIFILMTASILLRDIRLKVSWLIAAALVAALSIQGGVRLMEREAKGQWTIASLVPMSACHAESSYKAGPEQYSLVRARGSLYILQTPATRANAKALMLAFRGIWGVLDGLFAEKTPNRKNPACFEAGFLTVSE